MGNLCCKPSKKDNFSSPGRVVGAAPAPPPNPQPTAKIPSPATTSKKPQASSSDTVEARRKAAEAAEVSTHRPLMKTCPSLRSEYSPAVSHVIYSTSLNPGAYSENWDTVTDWILQKARAQAATQASKQGKLGGQLAEQKKQTRTDTLNQVSEENRRARDMDANTAVMNYN